jgi:hypothetical protein
MNQMHDDHLTHLLRSLEERSEPDPTFADELFAQLSTAAAQRSRGGRSLFVLLAAGLMLAALSAGIAVGSGLVHLPGLSREPLPAPTAVPTATAAASTPATSTATASAAPTTQPAVPATLAADTIVESLIDGLTVRGGTGLSAPKLGSVAVGQQAFVIGGPREADGYSWYRLSGLGVPQNSGCTGEEPTDPFGCPIWMGWAAAADLDGTAWLAPSRIDCPTSPLGPDDFDTDITRIRQLACHGNTPLTVQGYWPIPPNGSDGICPVPDDLQWIGCNEDLTHLTASEDAGFLEGPIFMLVAPPDVTMPEPGQWLEVTGHYDDPIAEECLWGDDPGASILNCRTQFVVDTARPVAPPA